MSAGARHFQQSAECLPLAIAALSARRDGIARSALTRKGGPPRRTACGRRAIDSALFRRRWTGRVSRLLVRAPQDGFLEMTPVVEFC